MCKHVFFFLQQIQKIYCVAIDKHLLYIARLISQLIDTVCILVCIQYLKTFSLLLYFYDYTLYLIQLERNLILRQDCTKMYISNMFWLLSNQQFQGNSVRIQDVRSSLP